jgi:hypothetical protein
MFQIKIAEKIRTHILGSKTPLPLPSPPENNGVYEIM